MTTENPSPQPALLAAIQRSLNAWETTTLKTNGDGMLSEALEALRVQFDAAVQAPEGGPSLAEAGRKALDAYARHESNKQAGLGVVTGPALHAAMSALQAALAVQPQPTRSQRLADAGYTRRPSWKSLPKDGDDEGSQAPAEGAAVAHMVETCAGADVFVHGVRVPTWPIGCGADDRRAEFVDAVNRAAKPQPKGTDRPKLWSCQAGADRVATGEGPGRCNKHCGDEQRCVMSSTSAAHDDGLTDEQINEGYRNFALRTTAVVLGGRKSFLAGVEFTRAALAGRADDDNELMAECMRVFRSDMIAAGVIGKSVPPMMMSEAILRAIQAPAVRAEPDCWAILTPNGSKLVSPDEAKGRKDAYPLYTHPATAAPTQAARDVLAERQRQIEKEGWTPRHDDLEHDGGNELARAAAVYANPDLWNIFGVSAVGWPWESQWFKPTNDRRNWVKAAALLLAAIEQKDRA